MTMLALAALLTTIAATPAPSSAPAPIVARSRVSALVRIVQAAEVRGGRSSEPHQRRLRKDEQGRPQFLVEFE